MFCPFRDLANALQPHTPSYSTACQATHCAMWDPILQACGLAAISRVINSHKLATQIAVDGIRNDILDFRSVVEAWVERGQR